MSPNAVGILAVIGQKRPVVYCQFPESGHSTEFISRRIGALRVGLTFALRAVEQCVSREQRHAAIFLPSWSRWLACLSASSERL